MSLLETTIGWLAPPECIGCGREGSNLCLACATSEIVPFGQHCWLCNKTALSSRTCPTCRPSSPRHVWITTNYDGVAKELIRVYKFAQQRAAVSSISQLMVQALMDFIDMSTIQRLNYLIVPVPTATSRLRRRGFGHSELLADKIAKQLKLQSANTLGRLGQSRQVGAKRRDRLVGTEGNYFVRKAEIVKARNILLVDDVVTTGSTIKSATKELRQAGAWRIDALIFAKKL